MKPPADCRDMTELRAAIDALDGQLVALLCQRAGYIDRAVEIKREAGLPARIPVRVEEVVAKVVDRAAAEGLDPELVESLWRQLIDWSIAREERVLGETEDD